MAGGKSDSGTMVTKLVLTIVGVLLIIATPFSIAFLDLFRRFQPSVLAGVEFVGLVAGLALLYLGFREKALQAKV